MEKTFMGLHKKFMSIALFVGFSVLFVLGYVVALTYPNVPGFSSTPGTIQQAFERMLANPSTWQVKDSAALGGIAASGYQKKLAAQCSGNDVVKSVDANGNPSCAPVTRTQACAWLPANAVWNSVSSIVQTRAGGVWSPTDVGSYSATASTTSCAFNCASGYAWNGTTCVSQIKYVSVDVWDGRWQIWYHTAEDAPYRPLSRCSFDTRTDEQSGIRTLDTSYRGEGGETTYRDGSSSFYTNSVIASGEDVGKYCINVSRNPDANTDSVHTINTLFRKVSGICGSSNGGSFYTTPSVNLCAVWTPSAVTLSSANDVCPNKYTIKNNRTTRYGTTTYQQGVDNLPNYTETGNPTNDYLCDVYISQSDASAWNWEGYGTLRIYKAKNNQYVFVAPWLSSNGVYYTYPVTPDESWKWTCNESSPASCSANKSLTLGKFKIIKGGGKGASTAAWYSTDGANWTWIVGYHAGTWVDNQCWMACWGNTAYGPVDAQGYGSDSGGRYFINGSGQNIHYNISNFSTFGIQ